MRQRSNITILLAVAFFVIGAAIVFLVLNDDDPVADRSGAGSADVTVFVASEDIPANTVGAAAIEQGLLSTETVAAGTQPVGAITSAAALDNQIFAVDVGKGDVITSSQLVVRSLSNISVPEGFDGVAVEVAYTNGGAGYVAPGDRVNVYGVFAGADVQAAGLATAAGETGGTNLPRVELLLTNVLVLDVSAQQASSVNSTAATNDGTQTSRVATATPLTYFLALTPTDIERVVLAGEFADLYVSLTADGAPNVTDTPGADGSTVLAPVSADSAPRG